MPGIKNGNMLVRESQLEIIDGRRSRAVVCESLFSCRQRISTNIGKYTIMSIRRVAQIVGITGSLALSGPQSIEFTPTNPECLTIIQAQFLPIPMQPFQPFLLPSQPHR